VSDDGSSDGTLQILYNFATRFPVTILPGPRQGAARNFLTALCHPDLPRGIVALADQDDVWLPGKLARGLRRMQASPGDGPLLYAAESALADATLRPFRISSPGTAQPSFAASLAQNLFGGHTTMFNAETLDLLRQAGPRPEVVFHDWWIYQLVAGAGGRLVLDHAPTALYRQHAQNILGASARTGAFLRLWRVLTGRWQVEMRAHALALDAVRTLLTPDSAATLDAFLAAPRRGPGRVQRFRRLGIRRSSASGTFLMLGAAFAGLL
jgi:glycosyltransferase involved in cell wall biosynthesis